MQLGARFSARPVGERFAEGLALIIIISARPLADLSPARVAPGLSLSRGQKNARAEELRMLAYSQASKVVDPLSLEQT